MTHNIRSIGILGAGKLGIVLAQLALKAGYEVNLSGSGDPKKIALSVSVLAPGAHADWSEKVAEQSNVIVLALPLGKYQTVPKEALKGKLVIDAMNYWWEVDGDRPDLTDASISSSEIVQTYISDARVVKALSHVGYHDLHDSARPRAAEDRKAVAIAGDDEADVRVVSELVDALGFDPLVIGDLAEGRTLQPGSPAFGVSVNLSELQEIISRQ